MRGEHLGSLAEDTVGMGSSPHARGTPDDTTRDAWFDRDHPRMRGEHSELDKLKPGDVGSSPHARGTHA